MLHTLELARRAKRLRASAIVSGLLALTGACNGADNLAPKPPVAANFDSVGTDSLVQPMTLADSLGAADSVALADSLAAAGALATEPSGLVPEFASIGSINSMHFGTFDCTSSGRSTYNFCIRAAGSWSAGEMRALQALGAKLILAQGGYAKFKDSRGRYNAAKYHKWVQSHKRYVDTWKPFLRSGHLVGVQVIDDRLSHNWGGRDITNAQIDEMAKWWKQLLPGITTFVSGGYASNLLGYKWRYLDGSINQYNASYMGDVRAWRDKAVAAARSARTSLILSLNVINGGKRISGCFRAGNRAACSMSPKELRTYGAVLASSQGICAVATYMFNPAYQARPGVTYALKYVARLATNRSLLSCKRR